MEARGDRKWLWRALIAITVLVIVAVLFVAALPWLARPMVAGALSAALGRPVSIAALRWDASAFSVVADDIHIGSAPEELTVKRVTVVVDQNEIDRSHVVVDRITVEAPTGTIALDALGGDAGEPAKPPKLPLAVTVRELVVSDAAIAVHPPRVAGSDVAVAIARASAADIELADGALVLTGDLTGTVDGAPLQGKIEVRMAPDERHITGTLTVKKLPLREGVMPLPPSIKTMTGTVDATARLVVGGTPARDTVELDVRIAKVRTTLASGTSLNAAQLSLPAARVDLGGRRIDLGPVNVQEPVVALDLASTAAPPPPAAGEPHWSVRSGPVTVRGGQVRVRRGDTALAAKIDRVRWDGLRDTPTQLAVTATAPSGGKLAIDGPVRVDPFSADLAVHAEGLAFAPWAELLKLPVAVERGTLTGTAHIDYTDRLRSLSGELRAIDVHTRPPDPARPTEVLAVATAAASFSFTPGEPGAIDMPSLTLSYPYAMVVRSTAGTFPSSLLGGGDGGGAAPTLRIGRLDIVDGKLEFVDETVQPPFWTSLTDIAATAEQVALPPGTVDNFTLAGKRDEISPVAMSGTYGADGLGARVEVKDVLLDSLNPYISPRLGYRITAGRLSTVATTTPKPPLLISAADLVLNGVDVLQTGTDVILEQSGVPLPIALSLIADSAGRIDLKLPFSIDTRSGDVTIGSIVWQAVRRAIVTALTSPLRILGSLFGTGGAPHAFAVDPIPFPTGSGELDTAGQQRVGQIARIVQAHPSLLLVLLPQVTDAELQTVGAAGAEALANARNAAVRDALLSGASGPALPAKRLLLAPWEPGKGAQATGQPGVYVELQDAG